MELDASAPRLNALGPDRSVPGTGEPPAFSTESRYVRLRRVRPDGYVEFDFAIGEPGLSMEMILPQAAYDEFCAAHRVCHLSAQQGAELDFDQAKWRYGQPGLTD